MFMVDDTTKMQIQPCNSRSITQMEIRVTEPKKERQEVAGSTKNTSINERCKRRS